MASGDYNQSKTVEELMILVDSGYAPDAIILDKGSKKPSDSKWPTKPYTTAELIRRVEQGANIGLRLTRLAVLDIEDSTIGDIIADTIKKEYPDAPIRSREGSQSRAFLFRTDGHVAGWKINRPDEIPGDHDLIVELISGAGRQLHTLGTRFDKGGVRLEWSEIPSIIDLPALDANTADRLGLIVEGAIELAAPHVFAKRVTGASNADHGRDNAGSPETINHDLLVRAVSCIPNDDDAFLTRDQWLDMGHAIFGASGGSDWGFDIWLDWCSQQPQKPGEPERVWHSFSLATCRSGAGFIRQQLDRLGERELLGEATGELFGDLPPLLEDGADDDLEDDGQPIPGVYFDGDAPPAPVATIVDQLIPAEGLTFIGGQSGAGKSFVAVELSLALASGVQFFGRDVEERVGVIYVAAEGFATIGPRLTAAKIPHFFGVEDESLPIAVIKDVPDLSVKAERKTFTRTLRKVARRIKTRYGVRVGAMVVDTLGAACTMKDENSGAEINALCRGLLTMGSMLGAATIVLHHYGKDAAAGLRGSSALRGAGDSILAVTADRNELRGRVSNRRLTHVKSRTDREGDAWAFDLENERLGERPNGRPWNVARVMVGDYFPADGEYDEETGGETEDAGHEMKPEERSVILAIYRNPGKKAAAYEAELGMSKTKFWRIVQKLKKHVQRNEISNTYLLTKKMTKDIEKSMTNCETE